MDNSPGIIGGMLFGCATAVMAMMLFRSGEPGNGALWFVIGYTAGWLLAYLTCRAAASTADAWSQVLGGLGLILFLFPILLIQKMATQPELLAPGGLPGIQRPYPYSLSPYLTLTEVAFAFVGCYPPALVCAILSRRFEKIAKLEKSLSDTTKESRKETTRKD